MGSFLAAWLMFQLTAAPGVRLQDEGALQGQAVTVNCVGAGISCTASGGVGTLSVAGGGSLTLTTVEQDLGSTAAYSGTFDITTTGLTAARPVLIFQAAGPYTGKGDREDEAEMDLVTATGYTVSTTVIRVYWTVQPYNGPVSGNVKFAYIAG